MFLEYQGTEGERRSSVLHCEPALEQQPTKRADIRVDYGMQKTIIRRGPVQRTSFRSMRLGANVGAKAMTLRGSG